MPATFVTAFYVIPNTNSSIYLERLERLIQTGIPLLCYLDESLKEKSKEFLIRYPNLRIPKYVTLDTSWIPEDVQLPFKRSETKDTKDYFAVQLQKAWCLADAAKYTVSSHLAWIDAGIIHIFTDTTHFKAMLQAISKAFWPSDILVPGSWTDEDMALATKLNEWAHLLDFIRWRFLGGFLLGPRTRWQEVYEKQTALVKQYLPRLGWEVNYWSELNLFKWYSADHNETMITKILLLRAPTQRPIPPSNVTFVTAFYIIPNKLRSVDNYLESLEQLIQTGIHLLCYMDKSLEEQGIELCKKYSNFTIPQYVTIDTSWIPENVIMPEIRNYEKDTPEYFAVQLQKTWCLADAARYTHSSHLAWIDAGIVHIFPDVDKAKEYLQTIATSVWPNEILCPGAMWKEVVEQLYGEGKQYTMFSAICWRYLGGFLLGPTNKWQAFYEKQTECVKSHLPHLVWEINYWAMLKEFTWYSADHNMTIFENLMPLRLSPSQIVLADSS